MSEETKGADKSAAWAIIVAIGTSAIAGWGYLLALLFSIQVWHPSGLTLQCSTLTSYFRAMPAWFDNVAAMVAWHQSAFHGCQPATVSHESTNGAYMSQNDMQEFAARNTGCSCPLVWSI